MESIKTLNKETVINFVQKELGLIIRNNKSRKQEYVFARTIVFYVCREYFNMTLLESGKMLNRDHATALHCIRNILPHLYKMKPYNSLIFKIDKIFELGGNIFEAEAYFDRISKQKIEDAKDLDLKSENRVLKDRIRVLENRLTHFPKNNEIYELLQRMPKRKSQEAEDRMLKSLRLLYNA